MSKGKKIKRGLFKRSFAKIQYGFDDLSYRLHHEKKVELFRGLHGHVLEIGPGTGVNFPFLKQKPIVWQGIEPNPAMHPFLYRSAALNEIRPVLVEGASEEIDLDANSMDYVISTEVLCSVSNLSKSLSEIKRVLKPKGRFVFLEHVVDKKDIWRRSIQSLLPYTPWRYFSDGCDPSRDIGTAIKNAKFSEVNFSEYMVKGKGVIVDITRPHICGWAQK